MNSEPTFTSAVVATIADTGATLVRHKFVMGEKTHTLDVVLMNPTERDVEYNGRLNATRFSMGLI